MLRLFTGKGGVGKSTLVAGVALACAERGQRPLVVELGHRASMEGLFGVEGIGYAPREVAPGVHARNAEARDAIEDYVVTQVKVRALARRIVQQKTLAGLLEAAPAVTEVVTLDMLDRVVREGRFDPVLVDLDATGHAKMFLSLPEVFAGLARKGPLATLLERTTALLRQADTVLHLVGLPAPLPAQELLELDAALQGQGAVRLGAVALNRVPPTPPSREGADPVRHHVELALAERAARAHAQAEAAIARIAGAIDRPLVQLPEVERQHVQPDLEVMTGFGRRFLEGAEARA